jgi:aldehyde dehydrogenase (NAD+)
MSNPTVHPEHRMLVDGDLVDAEDGTTFANVNPATEEEIGQVADASPADMRRAIDAARRAFDETDWSTNRALRARCLEQLQEALEGEREELREQLSSKWVALARRRTARRSTGRSKATSATRRSSSRSSRGRSR